MKLLHNAKNLSGDQIPSRGRLQSDCRRIGRERVCESEIGHVRDSEPLLDPPRYNHEEFGQNQETTNIKCR
jgi:hypothetical protein